MQRRLDTLGRIVIPKEIRKVLKLEEGDYLNISIDQNSIRLEKNQKYQFNKEIKVMIEMMEKHYGTKIIYISSQERDNIHLAFYNEVRSYHQKEFHDLRIYQSIQQLYSGLIYPLIIDQEWIGSFVLLHKSLNTNTNVLSYLCGMLMVK